MLANLTGLDHVVVLVRSLDAAAQAWRGLGFTLSPRGAHSAHMGTGNHTIMLGPDYLELLGIMADTPYNAPSRALLAQREGIERAAFATSDATALALEMRACGIEPNGPIDFGRPVDLPGGGKAQARFRTVHWPLDRRPGALRIFACQHLTPEAVWLPDLRGHANTARCIDRIEVLTPAPAEAAGELGRLIGAAPAPEPDGAHRVQAGGGAVVFLDRACFAARRPGLGLDGMPQEGGAAIVLRVEDITAAARSLEGRALAGEGRLTVPPTAATGVVVEFVPDERSS